MSILFVFIFVLFIFRTPSGHLIAKIKLWKVRKKKRHVPRYLSIYLLAFVLCVSSFVLSHFSFSQDNARALEKEISELRALLV